MFTGIIEAVATIQKVEEKGSNRTFHLHSPLAADFKVDQSISHNGVCLTVEAVSGENYTVTAVAETLAKTALNNWHTHLKINLERAMQLNGRFDGHIVQGHADGTAECIGREDKNGSTEFTFRLQQPHGGLLVEKGSLCMDGISLTIFNVQPSQFTVAIIPYTLAHTNVGDLQPGTMVNIEFDVIGKYVKGLMQNR